MQQIPTGLFQRPAKIKGIISLMLATVLLLSGLLPAPGYAEELGGGAAPTGNNASTESPALPGNPDQQTSNEVGATSPKYKPGWNEVAGKKYYANASGALVSGWLDDQGKRYYLDPSDHNAMATGFATVQGEIFYLGEDGVLQKASWLRVEGKWYYAAQSGELVLGWINLQGTWYYLDPAKGGEMLTGSFAVESVVYHAYENGALVTGNGWVLADEAWYFVFPSGALQTGWLNRGGTWYWLDPTSGAMATGWAKATDGLWYFFDSSGAMQTGWLSRGGGWYWLTDSGAMGTGWLNRGGTWYWLDPDSGVMATGWAKATDGSWYFFDSSGAMQTGWLSRGGGWYHLSGSGAMNTGWLQDGSTRYWLDPDTGVMATGTQIIKGVPYTFSSSGAMDYNVWIPLEGGACGFLGQYGDTLLSGRYDAQGRIVCTDGKLGWRTVNGMRFYFDPDDAGVLRTGLFKVGAKSYYANDLGIMQTGWIHLQGTWYYFDTSSGAMVTGWEHVGASWYYLAPANGAMATGWVQLDGAWYYLNPSSGAMLTGWASVGGTWYYLNESGAMVTGWLNRGGTWYYLDPAAGGAMRAGGWSWIGNVDYKFSSGGSMVGAWVDVPCQMQYPELPTGCESVALTNLLSHYGYSLSKTEIASTWLTKSLWDFVTAFAGDPFSWGGNYNACVAPAIVNAANSYLASKGSSYRAQDVSGSSANTLCSYLSSGIPIEVWTTTNFSPVGYCVAMQWYAGHNYMLFSGTHAVVLKGYDEEAGIVYVSDSISGDVTRDMSMFFSIYDGMDSQAVIMQPR